MRGAGFEPVEPRTEAFEGVGCILVELALLRHEAEPAAVCRAQGAWPVAHAVQRADAGAAGRSAAAA